MPLRDVLHIWWWTKRRPASQYPRRGRDRVLTTRGQGRRQELSPKLPGFGRPARPRNRSETPKKDLGKRWPRSTSTTAARTKFRGFQYSPWEYETDQRRPGLPIRSQRREFIRELQKAPHRANFPLHWRGSLARGSSARRPMPHTGSSGLVSAKRLLPVLKR